MRSLLILTMIAAVPTALAMPGPSANVFEHDTRVPVNHRDFPWSTIGKLSGPSGYCTATLVGRDLVLTAAHCVAHLGAKVKGEFRFFPGYAKGPGNLQALVVDFQPGTLDPEKEPALDWAIGRLDLPLGETLGWLGIELADQNRLLADLHYRIGAYSSDFQGGEVAALEIGCHFTAKLGSGQMLHNCSTSRGASGAVIFYESPTGNMVTAIATSEFGTGSGVSLLGVPYSDQRANIAIPSAAFYEPLRRLKGTP